MKKLLLSGAAIGFAATLATAAQAAPVPILWDFGVGTAGALGMTATQLSAPGAIPIVATAFLIGGATSPNPGLFRKELGGDETGLGLTNDPTSGEDEIHVGNGFIQLDTAALTSPPLTSLLLSFKADSTTAPDAWQVIGTNTAGSDIGVVLASGGDELIHTIDKTGFRYLDVSATAGNILLSEVDATANFVPEPATLALLSVGILGLGLVP
jgi:hypothetical protein